MYVCVCIIPCLALPLCLYFSSSLVFDSAWQMGNGVNQFLRVEVFHPEGHDLVVRGFLCVVVVVVGVGVLVLVRDFGGGGVGGFWGR